MTYRVYTYDPVSDDPDDGYEWRLRAHFTKKLTMRCVLRRLQKQGYTSLSWKVEKHTTNSKEAE